MREESLDVVLFLLYICREIDNLMGGIKFVDRKLRYARTALMKSPLFALVLDRCARPPRRHGAGVRAKGGADVLDQWAVTHVKKKVVTEIKALAPVLKTPPSEVNREKMLSIELRRLVRNVKLYTPTLWEITHAASITPKQLQRNKYKNPEPVRGSTDAYVRYRC